MKTTFCLLLAAAFAFVGCEKKPADAVTGGDTKPVEKAVEKAAEKAVAATNTPAK